MAKKTLHILFLLAITLLASNAFAEFGGGDGLTPETAYEISTPEQLAQLAAYVNNSNTNSQWASKHYKLVNNINLSAYPNWTPIGGITTATAFTGVFDGNNKVVSNLKITSGSYRGLFGTIAGGTIKNLGIEDVEINASGNFAGGIAAWITDNSVIENSYVFGRVNSAFYAGGIVGSISSSVVKNAYFMGEIGSNTARYIGGIAGSNSNSFGVIDNCWTTAKVSGTSYAGGIAGYSNGIIKNSVALNSEIVRTSGTDTNFGRIAGYQTKNFSNNFAYMLMPVMGVKASVGTAANKHGKNIGAKSILLDGTLGGIFTDAIWNVQAGFLPRFSFGDPIAIPEYLLAEASLEDIMLLITSAIYEAAYAEAHNATSSITAIEAVINALDLEEINKNFDFEVNPGTYTNAIAGDAHTPQGVNGSFSFTVKLVSSAGELTSDELTLVIIPPVHHSFFAEGEGTILNPYQIENSAQLRKLAELVNDSVLNEHYASKHYMLVNNIDLLSEEWTPIGYDNDYNFKGHFNGNGKVISNLKITKSGYHKEQGLFGIVNGGTIEKLGVENVEIIGNYMSVGGIASSIRNGSVVKNCYVTGTLKTEDWAAGGIVGYGWCSGTEGNIVENNWSNVVLSAMDGVGGIIGDQCDVKKVENNAALGISVNHNDIISDYCVNDDCSGRVMGYSMEYYNVDITYNIAYNGMLVAGSTVVSDSANGIHGLDKTVEEIKNGTAFVGMFTDPIWVKDPTGNYLPSFVGATPVPMPAHLRSQDAADLAIAMEKIKTAIPYIKASANAEAEVNSKITELNLAGISFEVSEFSDDAAYSFKVTLTKNSESLAENLSAFKVDFAGDGTNFWPYEIANEIQLALVAELVNNHLTNADFVTAHYILTSDIDLENYGNWIPIGNRYANPFRGNFNGNGYKIKNLKIDGFSFSYQGLFGNIDAGTIENIGLENVYIAGVSSNAGGIAGRTQNNTVVRNCYVTGTVSGMNYVSGIVGGNNSSSVIENCWSAVSLSGTSEVGGITGYNNAIVRNSAAFGSAIVISGGRVAGSTGGTFSSNVAWDGMTVNGSVITSGTATNRNGANITAQSIFADATIGGRFTAENGWALREYFLPGLGGKPVPLPMHLLNLSPADEILQAIENAKYIVQDKDAKTPEEAKTAVGNIIKNLVNANFEINEIAFNAAQSSPEPRGTNGSYAFTVLLLGKQSSPLTLNICASPHQDLANGGCGLIEFPYEIATKEQLKYLAAKVNGSADNAIYAPLHYKLINNIDLSSEEWTPIGTVFESFKGSFDGNSKKILNLSISSGEERVGLFGRIENGTVKNLGLVDANITGGNYTGAVAGSIAANSLIENVYATGTINGGNYTGGIVGDNNSSTIKNCWSTAEISGSNNVGGIAGRIVTALFSAKVENCAALGESISSTSTDYGRVTGNELQNSLENNIAYAEMKVQGNPISNSSANNKHGADKQLIDLLMPSGFPEPFKQRPWVYAPGKLPGLGEAVEMPGYIIALHISLTVNLNGSPWSSFNKTFKFKRIDDESVFVDIAASSSPLNGSLPNGTWKIYDGETYTGINIIAGETATINYYSISFAANPIEPVASASSVTAEYNGIKINSGDAVLPGGTLILTANGLGLANENNYAYSWSSSETTRVITINNVNSRINEICTINGTGLKKLMGTAIILINGEQSNENPVIGDVLTYLLEEDINHPETVHRWLREGTLIGTSASYTVAAEDFGKNIALEIRPNPDDWDITIIGDALTFYTKPVQKKTVLLAHLEYNIPTNHIYDGTPKGIGIATKNIEEIGNIKVLYNGSENIPANAGVYEITIQVAESQTYKSATFEAGLYAIAKSSRFYPDPARIDVEYFEGLTLEYVKNFLQAGYEFIPSLDTPLSIGNRSFKATYTDPSGNYEPVEGNIRVHILDPNTVPTLNSPNSKPQTPNLTFYNLQGIPVGTTQPTIPGIYIEKNGKNLRKIIVK